VRSVFFEGLLVAVIGGILAFAANALSPRGLALARNYFPGDRSRPVVASSSNQLATIASRTNAATGKTDLVAEQVRAEGLRLVDGNQMATLFRDPRCEQGLLIIVDARSDEHYQEGHIPGAYQLDHFHPERYLGTALPACQTAEQILVYCNGGACDDSLQTAIFLRDAGIPRERLFIYAGGIAEWQAKGLPVETGARKSGSILPGK
jgi:rhodanese-related sulfurtransferase